MAFKFYMFWGMDKCSTTQNFAGSVNEMITNTFCKTFKTEDLILLMKSIGTP